MQNSDTLFTINLDDFSNFCGIDEAGRGPIAGPLVVAGVILKQPIDGLADSKKLSKKRRETLFEKIQKNSKYYIHTIEASKIDEIGLSKALQESLLAIKDFFKVNDYLFDGNSTFGVNGITTMVKADAKVASVALRVFLPK
jgi:ribonuclease HII